MAPLIVQPKLEDLVRVRHTALARLRAEVRGHRRRARSLGSRPYVHESKGEATGPEGTILDVDQGTGNSPLEEVGGRAAKSSWLDADWRELPAGRGSSTMYRCVVGDNRPASSANISRFCRQRSTSWASPRAEPRNRCGGRFSSPRVSYPAPLRPSKPEANKEEIEKQEPPFDAAARFA